VKPALASRIIGGNRTFVQCY